MRHMIGFILFWIAIGMTIMFFISNAVIAVLIILLCLVLGYNLFCSQKQSLRFASARIAKAILVGCTLHNSNICCSLEKQEKGPGIIPILVDSHIKGDCDYARSTAPERKHPVHTGIFLVPPFTFTRTDLMFGFHILLLLLCE